MARPGPGGLSRGAPPARAGSPGAPRWLHLVPALLLAVGAGCAARGHGEGTPRAIEVAVGQARVRILHWPEDARAARQVAQAVEAALPRATRWGPLEVPVTITVHPSHRALEEAVGRPGYAWLRAWARYATIDLQSPATWSLLGATDARVAELLAHELTHCVMYQRSATELSWPSKGIPLWFREGLASHAAGQGYRRGTLEDLWRHAARELPGGGDGEFPPGSMARAVRGRIPAGDPLREPELHGQEQADLVYGAAHHAFGFLLERYGEAAVRQVLERMRAGAGFAQAFSEACGLDEASLVADFRRYVVWQGWRRPPARPRLRRPSAAAAGRAGRGATRPPWRPPPSRGRGATSAGAARRPGPSPPRPGGRWPPGS